MKSMNVSSTKWQYSEKKMKYMYAKKTVKKYVCPSRGVSRVQPIVLDRGGGMRTMPTPVNIEVENLTNFDVYSGADEVLKSD